MKELSRKNLFANLGNIYESKGIPIYSTLVELCNINIILLGNLEVYFLASENMENGNITNPYYKDFMRSLQENISKLREYQGLSTTNLITGLEKEMKKWNEKSILIEYVFNRVVKLLSDFSDNIIYKILENETNEIKDFFSWESPLPVNYKPVFLSYAYQDLLYTIALYEFCYQNKILLYIDWMHNGPSKEGIVVKNILNAALENSEALIFLRTLNSELNISGKQYIRPWCSWETGNFYKKEKGSNPENPEKYVINLYDKSPEKNMQLHGFNLLTNIENGRLEGISI